MRLRRRTDLERVRHTFRALPPELLADDYGEEIVRLRGAIKQALDLLDADLIGGLQEARALLRWTLARGVSPRTTATRTKRAAGLRPGQEEVGRTLGS